MNALRGVIGWFKPRVKTLEDLEAAQEAERVRYEMENIRVGQLSKAGENYQSGRGTRH
jgi:hypothetical protein